LSDFLIGRHQREILAYLQRSDELVSALSPDNVRSRVLDDRFLRPLSHQIRRIEPWKVLSATGEHKESSKQHLRRILSVQQDITELDIEYESKPIADFFPKATVTFADIAGFSMEF
jgi:hypothetical protein